MLASAAARLIASPATATAMTRSTGTVIARGHVKGTVSDIASIAEARAFASRAGDQSRLPAIARHIQLPSPASSPVASIPKRGVSTDGPKRSPASSKPTMNAPEPVPATPAPHPDSMPRFPWSDGATVPGLLRGADWFGTAVFAMTGTLAAATRGMDILGSTIVGTITAVGGGTVRDLLLGRGRRAFWMEEIEYLWICVGTGVATFLAWPHLERACGVKDTDEWVDWADAIGVGAFCVIGAMNGIRAGVPCAAAVACGMFTATFGGVIRDVLVSRPVRILHSYTDIYATTALTGATTYMLVRAAGAPVSARILAGAGTAVALRKLAWSNDLRLPTYAGAEDAARARGDDGKGTRFPARKWADAVFEAMGFEVTEEEEEKVAKKGLFGRGKAD